MLAGDALKVAIVVGLYAALRYLMHDGVVTAQLLSSGSASHPLPIALATSYVMLRFVLIVLLPGWIAYKSCVYFRSLSRIPHLVSH
jgi:hypothetical protein